VSRKREIDVFGCVVGFLFDFSLCDCVAAMGGSRFWVWIEREIEFCV
jgi:hypothetical protein